MDEPRHMFVEAIFTANYDDGECVCCEKHKETDVHCPPVSGPPLWWLYGKEECEQIGLPGGEWGEAQWEEEFGVHLYTIQENAYFIPQEAWDKFANRYSYLPEYSENNMGMLGMFGDGGPWHRPGFRWMNWGEDWNRGGWTPVWNVCVSLTANEQEVRANPEHFGFEILEEETNV